MTRYIQLRLSSEPSRILHADDDHVAVEIAIIVARDMALHGHFHDSAAILAAAWSPAEYGGGVDRTFSLDFVYDTVDRIGLDLIWRGAKFTPTDVPDWASRLEQLGYTESQIEMKQRFYFCAVEHSTAPSILVDSSIAARWHEVQVMLAIRTDPMTGSQSFPDPELELQALSMLEVFIEQSVPLVHEWPDSRPHALALDLALKYHDWDLARKMLGLIGTRILNLASSAARDLALTLRAGQIAADTSILESITGLTKARAREVTIEVVNALKTRLSFGEPRPYADLSWATLLYEIEAREAELQEDEHEVVIPFLRRPASPGRIVLAETQLGIQLPQDYKDFLAVSDGIGSYNLTQTTPLLPVDEIFWDTDRQSLKVEYRRFETSNYQTHRTGQLPVLQRVLQISEADDEAATHWWLIEPSLVASAKRSMGENALPTWLGVNYADWNPVFSNRGSFRIMMERRLSALAQRTP